MSNKNEQPFILSQLDEALEERQRPDRRQNDQDFETNSAEDRRKSDRRDSKKPASA